MILGNLEIVIQQQSLPKPIVVFFSYHEWQRVCYFTLFAISEVNLPYFHEFFPKTQDSQDSGKIPFITYSNSNNKVNSTFVLTVEPDSLEEMEREANDYLHMYYNLLQEEN